MDAPERFLDYQATLAFVYGRINYERTPATSYRSRTLNLERMRALLSRLGDPHRQLHVVHVAGTKGKGSTATMITSILTAAGFRTGLYTSPHLERLEERIAVDGQPIGAAELVDLANCIQPAVAELDRLSAGAPGTRGPTFFEATTAMALLHFVHRAVDVAVVEVGLGGRLDSTNVCHPLVAVITSISYDHMRQLGNTLAAIAFEKAGIIKPGVPVVSGVIQDEPAEVIERTAAERNCSLYRLGREFAFTYRPPRVLGAVNGDYGSFDYQELAINTRRAHKQLALNLLGIHQAANASLAVAVADRLCDGGWNIPEAAIRQGVATAYCPARVEVLRHQPTIIVDTAHNVASIEALLRAMGDVFPPGPRLLIFAASRDKDPAGMLRRLLPHFDEVILTRFLNNPRATKPEELAALAKTIVQDFGARQPFGTRITVCPTPPQAWQECESRVTPEHLVCITGSFFLAAEMRSLASRTPVAP